MNTNDISHAVRDGVTRAVAVVGLAGIALIHLIDTPGKFSETPYLGWMYVGLIIACVAVAADLVATGSRRAWAAATALPVAVLVGFILSRTTGLPSATGDIGNWGEPLGIASMFVEGALALLAGTVLAALQPAQQRVRQSVRSGARSTAAVGAR